MSTYTIHPAEVAALPQLREDDHGVIPYAGTLAELQERLLDLLDRDVDAMEPWQLEEHALKLQAAQAALLQKVDAYAAVMRQMAVRAEQARVEREAQKAELDRLKAREERYERHLERMTDYALFVIRQNGTDRKGKYKPLEGETATLKPLGVAPSCEVIDADKVPFAHKRVTVQMPAETWIKLKESPDVPPAWTNAIVVKDTEVMRTSLLAALKKPCAVCEGTGVIQLRDPAVIADEPCDKCQGTGKQHIPGARLIDGKLRLTVE